MVAVSPANLTTHALLSKCEDAQKNPDCAGFVSIEIYKVGSLEFSWKADHPVFREEDVKPGLCEAALLTEIIPRLQARYDLADD